MTTYERSVDVPVSAETLPSACIFLFSFAVFRTFGCQPLARLSLFCSRPVIKCSRSVHLTGERGGVSKVMQGREANVGQDE